MNLAKASLRDEKSPVVEALNPKRQTLEPDCLLAKTACTVIDVWNWVKKHIAAVI